MTMTIDKLAILTNHPIRTWFNCGGTADRFARPATIAELQHAVEIDPNLRVLGDGANLLVADEGVRELVVELNIGEFVDTQINAEAGIISAGAGVNLPKLIHKAIAGGLTGLENLGGIPASIGGACVMNAGGAFGQFGDYLHAVHAVTRRGEHIVLSRDECRFDYRHTTFGPASSPHRDLIIARVDLKLAHGDAAAARAKLLEVMDYKKRTQPMAADSAGCTFKNPTLTTNIEGIGTAGQRVSAGMLIDRAGAKGLRIGGAEVSQQHGNFFITHPGCTATDLLALMRLVRTRVHERFGVEIQPEVAIWGATL